MSKKQQDAYKEPVPFDPGLIRSAARLCSHIYYKFITVAEFERFHPHPELLTSTLTPNHLQLKFAPR